MSSAPAIVLLSILPCLASPPPSFSSRSFSLDCSFPPSSRLPTRSLPPPTLLLSIHQSSPHRSTTTTKPTKLLLVRRKGKLHLTVKRRGDRRRRRGGDDPRGRTRTRTHTTTAAAWQGKQAKKTNRRDETCVRPDRDFACVHADRYR
jgi:hypothetical protein